MIQGKANIVVLGSGESGLGAALLAQQLGYNVFVSDQSQIDNATLDLFNKSSIRYEMGGHDMAYILDFADLVIKSPGIPDYLELIQKLKAQHKLIMDEIEFAYRHTTAKIIAVTGSNGKTTTASLIYHLLTQSGFDVALVGNIGNSFAKQIHDDPKSIYVVEVSSFQLDYTQEFKPKVSVLLNITPDHLDRYNNDMEAYADSKMTIGSNQSDDDVFIYNEDNKYITDRLGYLHSKVNMIPVSEHILSDDSSDLRNIEFDKTHLKGTHNRFNIACAYWATRSVGLSAEQFNEALKSFSAIPHRLEPIITLNAVDYINDSKATNVDAVYYALRSMVQRTVLILGGVDKGNDYKTLLPLIKEKVKAIICLGIDNSNIFKAFEGEIECIMECRSMVEAIKMASLYADEGDCVLLSPACASFDLFDNYIDRGNQFKKILLEQDRIMKEGIQVDLNIELNVNPGENKSDMQ